MNANKTLSLAFLFANCLATASSAELVTDEATRLRVLAAVFPKMSITATPTRKLDLSGHSSFGPAKFDFTDPLGGEMVYRITGSERSENEKCASEDVVSSKRSQIREARSRIYKIAETEFVAVSQYEFLGVSPAGACWSIARISLVQTQGGAFTDLGDFDPNTTHHSGVQRAEFVSLSSGAPEQLLVESIAGGGGGFEVDFLVFEFTGGKIVPLLNTPSVLSYWGETVDFFVQSLDIARTRATHGSRYCFTRTTYVEDNKHVAPPQVSRPCYKRGYGVEKQR